MSTFAERKQVAQEIAKVQVCVDVTIEATMNNASHSGTLFGLTVAALAIGITNLQVMTIRDTARRWADDNCPGDTRGPIACAEGCPNACQHIPLAPFHWR